MTSSMTVSAAADAPVARVWDLMALPACWPAWAGHMRHVRSAVSGVAPVRIHEGQMLRVFAGLPTPLRVTVTDVKAPEKWSMTAELPVLGIVTSSHDVRAVGRTTEVEVTVSINATGLVPRLLLQAYRPIALVAVRRLLAIAAAEASGQSVARVRMCQPDSP